MNLCNLMKFGRHLLFGFSIMARLIINHFAVFFRTCNHSNHYRMSFKMVQFVFHTDLNWPSYNGLNGYKCGKNSKMVNN